MKRGVKLGPTAKVWSFRLRAACWVGIGVWSFATGMQDSVVLVWLASLYANLATDLGAAQAADDRQLVDRLDRIERLLVEERL